MSDYRTQCDQNRSGNLDKDARSTEKYEKRNVNERQRN